MTSDSRLDGLILVSVPNFAHWYPRVRGCGGTLRLRPAGCSTAATSASSLGAASSGCSTTAAGDRPRTVVGSPVADVLDRGARASTGRLVRAAAGIDRVAAQIWPTMFGYQFLYVLRPQPGLDVVPVAGDRYLIQGPVPRRRAG